MPAILQSIKIDSAATLAKYFMLHHAIWIQADDYFHAQGKQAFALAENSVRIGWTFCDGFKNVRKRLRYKKRDYLFVTKDYPSALEYIRSAHSAAEFLDYTRAIVSHGEDYCKVNLLDSQGRPTSLTEEVKIGYIKFDNGSRIIAFSSNPYAMAVYGGDVGLDEFAKHPNAKLLWETAQARVTWAYDIAVWSSHDGQYTLFNEFAQQARATCLALTPSPPQEERDGERRPVNTEYESRNTDHAPGSNPSIHQSITCSPTAPPLQHSNSPFSVESLLPASPCPTPSNSASSTSSIAPKTRTSPPNNSLPIA